MNKKYEHIQSVSYVGKPLDNTVMYISKKVEDLLENLDQVSGCLVFAETGTNVPEKVFENNHFVFTDTPQLDYTNFISKIAEDKENKNKQRKYREENGSLVGENVSIGENAVIEPNCLIDHDVIIGKNAMIKSGTIIRNAVIGDNLLCNENSLVGSNGFNMAIDEEGNKVRIPTLGKVVLGNNVEIGSFSNVSCGGAGNTELHDNVKLDVHVHIGHDAVIRKNTEITAGVVISGFVEVGENCFLGVNSTFRNRISIGNNNLVGMAAAVTKDFDDNNVLIGNPARILRKKD